MESTVGEKAKCFITGEVTKVSRRSRGPCESKKLGESAGEKTMQGETRRDETR
jgi:hypothetical protein